MKKATKIISAVMAVVLVASAFAACSSKPAVPAKVVASIADLTGAKVGVQLGTTGDTAMTKLEKDGTTVARAKTGHEAVQSLLQGKVDAVVIDNEPAKVFVEKNTDKLKLLDEPFAEEKYAICLAKDKTELTAKINGALGELTADGTIEKIKANYIGDAKGSFQYTSPAGTTRTNGKMKMATNAQFAPYEYLKDGSTTVVGIDPDIALAIADKLGMELEIMDMDFDAVILAVTGGKADIGMAGLTVDETRLKSVNFTDTYCIAKQVIIVKK